MIETLTLDYTDTVPFKRKRVLLIDDHVVVRKGLAMLINEEFDLQVCGEAEDERSARDAAARLRPDVAVVDWSLGQKDAAELIRNLHETHPNMSLLVLSMHDEVDYVERALRVGAIGYVMKREATDRVVEGIRRIAQGYFYLTDRAIDALPQAMKSEIAVRDAKESPKRSSGLVGHPSLAPASSKADLVIAPHPDDETFGCGGTIRLVAESGTPVDVVFMTRGELGHEEGQAISEQQQTDLARVRSAEALEACKALGARQVFFLDGKDTRLNEQSHLAADLLSILEGSHYRRVFCPWKGDAHQDHVATFLHLQAALKRYPAPLQLWLYEVWTPQEFNTLIPIDHTVVHKKMAIANYRSQLTQLNYREGFIGLSAYRSAFCPPANYAEAFFVCSKEEVLSL